MRWFVKFSSNYLFNSWNTQKNNYFWAGNETTYWDELYGFAADASSRTLGELRIEGGPGHTPTWLFNGTAPAVRTFERNRWYAIEAMIQGPSTPTASDGQLKVWVNGLPYITYTGLPSSQIRNPGDGAHPITIRTPWLSHYYGGNPCQPHPTMTVSYDQIVISRAAIGSSLSSPTNLTITGSTRAMTWTDNATGEGGYQLQVSTDGGSVWSDRGPLLAVNATSTGDPTGPANAKYRVVARTNSTDSWPSNVVDAPPPVIIRGGGMKGARFAVTPL